MGWFGGVLVEWEMVDDPRNPGSFLVARRPIFVVICCSVNKLRPTGGLGSFFIPV